MVLDIIEGGLAVDNEEVELNHLVFECNKMLSDMWQGQELSIDSMGFNDDTMSSTKAMAGSFCTKRIPKDKQGREYSANTY
eukprot:9237722-Ditylum_brightwellii.AAC.1